MFESVLTVIQNEVKLQARITSNMCVYVFVYNVARYLIFFRHKENL